MKSKTLPSIRIESKTDSQIQLALKKLNENSLVEINLQQFRRIAYEFTCQKIISGEKIKLQS
jgi:hypothetical protein